jgi:myo-inositol-1(or 4)-monophosphatase
VRETRKISLPHFGNIEVKLFKSDSFTGAVTEIDQEVENYLKNELAKIMPEVSFVGEEFGGNRDQKTFWLVDPIDGTGHYVRGIPFCTTMLALIENGKVIFSVIYDFVNDVIYHAELGHGAYKNDERMFVSKRNLKAAYLSVEVNSRKETNRALLTSIRSRANLIQTLSAGHEFILVASGKTEGRITYDGFGKDYDFAPGTLLVSEAGGVVRNFNSDSYDYTNLNFIAANSEVYAELIESEDSIVKLMDC